MNFLILHDLDGEEVLVNINAINAATRKYPDETSMIKNPFTKLYYINKDKGMDAVGFPDVVKESPAEILEAVKKP